MFEETLGLFIPCYSQFYSNFDIVILSYVNPIAFVSRLTMVEENNQNFSKYYSALGVFVFLTK